MKMLHEIMVGGASGVLWGGRAGWRAFCKLMTAWAEASEPGPTRWWR